MAIAIEGAAHGQPWLWTAPTYDQVRIGWEESKRACGRVARFNQDRMTATFPSGGLILYRSLDDPDNARGHTAAGVVMDEASVVKPEAWYEVIRPMLLDTGGPAWFLFTPTGRNWVWRESLAAVDRADSAAWQVPTVGCRLVDGRLERVQHPYENPDVAFGEIEQLWRTLPERVFRQEILAEFLEDAGVVFRRVMEAATAAAEAWVPIHRYVVGVDWGKYTDFTVLSVLNATTRCQVAQERFNQIDYQLQLGRLEALCAQYHPEIVVVERNSMGEPLIEQLVRAGLPILPFTTTNATKAQAIDALALAFEQGTLSILPDPTLIGELQAYEMERLPSGLLRYNAPQGMHDDTVMALALAWQGVVGPGRQLEWAPNPLADWRG